MSIITATKEDEARGVFHIFETRLGNVVKSCLKIKNVKNIGV